jgi:hypothetical protein
VTPERLRLVASAVAGRPVEVAGLEAGERAWTDGATLFVDLSAAPLEQIAVQASLLAGGSLDPAVVGALVRRPTLARRYLTVEGHRALVANEQYLPPVVRTLADRLVASVIGSPDDSLAVARSRRTLADPPAVFGMLRPQRLLAVGEGSVVPSAEPEQMASAPADQELDEDADGADLGRLLSSPVGGRGLLGRLLQRLLGATRGERGDGPAGADAPTHRGRARERRDTQVTRAVLGDSDSAPAFGPRTATYPEWDVNQRRYRPDWCTVHEREPVDLAPMALPDGLALRRSLARLGAGLDRVRRRPQGDDVDIDAVVESQVEALAGGSSDGLVYVESLRRRRDLSALILLDVSGSAAEMGPGGRSVHDHQRQAAAALARAFHDLGDRVAVHAFNSQGRTAVHVTRVKGFDDRALRGLGGLTPAAYTRLGAAIRHGTATVASQGGTARRLLVVLSDGFAYDHGYGGRYGEADARRALTEARRQGIGCVCLSIGARTPPAALARVFGTAAHAAVPTADDLPALVAPPFRAALRAAEAQRRTFQRTYSDRAPPARTVPGRTATRR